MKKITQRDTLASRGALITGCSMWRPILSPVRPADGAGRLGNDKDGAHGECNEARIDEQAEGPAVMEDFSV